MNNLLNVATLNVLSSLQGSKVSWIDRITRKSAEYMCLVTDCTSVVNILHLYWYIYPCHERTFHGTESWLRGCQGTSQKRTTKLFFFRSAIGLVARTCICRVILTVLPYILLPAYVAKEIHFRLIHSNKILYYSFFIINRIILFSTLHAKSRSLAWQLMMSKLLSWHVYSRTAL